MGHFYSVYDSIVCLVSALIRKSHRSSGPTGRDKIPALRRDKDFKLMFPIYLHLTLFVFSQSPMGGIGLDMLPRLRAWRCLC